MWDCCPNLSLRPVPRWWCTHAVDTCWATFLQRIMDVHTHTHTRNLFLKLRDTRYFWPLTRTWATCRIGWMNDLRQPIVSVVTGKVWIRWNKQGSLGNRKCVHFYTAETTTRFVTVKKWQPAGRVPWNNIAKSLIYHLNRFSRRYVDSIQWQFHQVRGYRECPCQGDQGVEFEGVQEDNSHIWSFPCKVSTHPVCI